LTKSQLTLEQASFLLRALLFLAVVVSTVATAMVSLYLQSFAPQGAGIAYSMFSYHKEVVGISLLGAVLPVLVAAVGTISISYFSWPARLSGGVLGAPFLTAILVVAILSVSLFTVSSYLYGGLYLPKLWAEAMVFSGAAGGAIYAWYRRRGRRILLTTVECYAIGTLGMVLSDLIRTATGLAYVPGGAAIWGGGGLLDFVFWFGIYLALGSAIFGALSKSFSTLSRTTWTFKVRSSVT